MGEAKTILVGPILCRDGGYAFDIFTPGEGLKPGFAYRRVEQAHYDRRTVLGARGCGSPILACETEAEFSRRRASTIGEVHGLEAAGVEAAFG
jgi:hypothetical protein